MKTILMTLLALGSITWIANAQNAGGPPDGNIAGGQHPGRFHHPPPLPLVLALDANHDGVISADEMANAGAALLTLDKNGDGKLTSDEYLPMVPANAPKDAPRPPLPPIVKALDANGDGVIDANEIANAPAALKSLDKNGDGELSRNEFCPPPSRHHGDMENGGQSGPPDDAPDGPPPGQE